MLLLIGCSQQDSSSIAIELEETNDSGISGTVELTPEGTRRTRITVTEVEGGEITGVRVMPDACKPDGLDDKYPVRPPAGLVQIPFEELRTWVDDGRALAAAFMRRGRYVSCGEA